MTGINTFPRAMSKVFRLFPGGRFMMTKDLKRHGQARAVSTIGWQPAPMNGFVNIGPALLCSTMTRFFNRPYPVQFRAQGALDAWTHALGNTELWPLWRDPATLCWQIRQEILRQLEGIHPRSSVAGQISGGGRRRCATLAPWTFPNAALRRRQSRAQTHLRCAYFDSRRPVA